MKPGLRRTLSMYGVTLLCISGWTGSAVAATAYGSICDTNAQVLCSMAREAVIATNAPASSRPRPVSAAVALRAVLPQTTALTAREQDLLREWLDRIAASR